MYDYFTVMNCYFELISSIFIYAKIIKNNLHKGTKKAEFGGLQISVFQKITYTKSNKPH